MALTVIHQNIAATMLRKEVIVVTKMSHAASPCAAMLPQKAAVPIQYMDPFVVLQKQLIAVLLYLYF
jgi:hypothetical protein